MNVNRIHTPSHTLPSNKPAAAAASKAFDEQLHAKSPTPTNGSAGDQEGLITPTEKAYFEQMYPASAEAVRAYTPYRRDGLQSVANVGSLVDRKG